MMPDIQTNMQLQECKQYFRSYGMPPTGMPTASAGQNKWEYGTTISRMQQQNKYDRESC